MATSSQITLYTDSTPNGIKISMALEELSLEYKVEHINISSGKQKEPWFLEINPNGRIPAITDEYDDGKPIHIFEGGSILQYLVDRYDPDHKLSFPRGSREAWECNNWLFFQHGGIGPMQGQAAHFNLYAPTKIQYGIDRYLNETRRLFRVIETQLAKSKSGFLVGEHLSIADIANLSWIIYGKYTGVDMDEFPAIHKWDEMLSARPGISRGFHVPKDLKMKKDGYDAKIAEEYAKQASQWILKGMEEDSKKSA